MHAISKRFYKELALDVLNYTVAKETNEYEACTFKLNDLNVISRKSKIIPKKVGQFVAIWKRNTSGITQPYDISDNIDFLVINNEDGDKKGQFVFSREVLVKHNLVGSNNKGGKRGVRLYSPWDTPLNKIALATQKWQINYFIELSHENNIDLARAKKLYRL